MAKKSRKSRSAPRPEPAAGMAARLEPAGRSQPSAGSEPAESAASKRAGSLLALAAAAVAAVLLAIRVAAPQPWDYDEYYHLGMARELRHHFPLRAFPWTPFSVLAHRFADKEPLFHALLMPFAGLSIERATLAGVLLGQVGFVLACAFFLRRLRVPAAPWFLLALTGLGPMFILRLEMCRPHVWMITFSIFLLALLFGRARLVVLAVASALFGLVHAGGWIGILYAAVWAAVSWRMGGGDDEAPRRPSALAALAAVTVGYAAGQLLHPNFPANLSLLWTVNVGVPLHSLGAGSAALQRTLGTELRPLKLDELARQWPAFLAPALAAAALLRRPALRSREAVTLVLLALAFLGVACLALSRFFEVGAPLGLLSLALVAGEAARRRQPLLPGGRLAAGLVLGIAALWTLGIVQTLGFGISYPDEMARWLGANGAPGEVVFTAQWADSEPLFYYAPQLRSLVVLDPTFLYAQDPARFEDYARIAYGQSADPVGVIEARFQARWVTVWKVPAYRPLVQQFLKDRRAKIVFNDDYYQVWRLEPGNQSRVPLRAPAAVRTRTG